MIRPASRALREHPWKTALVAGSFAVAMALPAVAMFSASTADRLLRRWLADYRPVVYLTPDIEEKKAKKFAERVHSWEGVAKCTVRSPNEAYSQAASRLGEKRVGEVGVKPEMFPFSLIVEPTGGVADVGVVSRLESLETNEEIDSVDVPSTEVGDWLSALGTFQLVGLVLFALFVGIGVLLVADYLRELRYRERRELRLLERLGAPPNRLRRKSMVRGAILGIWSGLATSGLLLAIALYWRTIEASLLGGVLAAAPRSWLVVAAPLVVGPAAGAVAGVWAARRSLGETSFDIPELEPMLDHE